MKTIAHDEAMLVVHTKKAIQAMNNLICFLNEHGDLLPASVRQRIVEADYMLNSAEDYFITDYPEEGLM